MRIRPRVPTALAVLTAIVSIASLLLVASSKARADILPEGMKGVEVTFEVTGIAEHPDFVFVVFPFLNAEIDEAFLKMNPHLDVPGTNYQVLRPGERYPMPKFGGGRIFAFLASGFPTAVRTLTADEGFYRKKGSDLVILPEFDALTNSQKRRLVESDPRVRPSDMLVALPLLVDQDSSFVATHDVLRIVSIDDKRSHVEGVKVTYAQEDGATSEAPYEGGRRPEHPTTRSTPTGGEPHDPSGASGPSVLPGSEAPSAARMVWVAVIVGGIVALLILRGRARKDRSR